MSELEGTVGTMLFRRRKTAPEPTPVAATGPLQFMTAEDVLAKATEAGLDLSDPDAVIDAVTKSLVVLTWKMTPVDLAHREQVSESAGYRSWRDRMDAGLQPLDVPADRDEEARLKHLVEGRLKGYPIPDDVMLRVHASTCVAVRRIVAENMPAGLDSVPEDAVHLPWLDEVRALLADPGRPIAVGAGTLTTRGLLAGRLGAYVDESVNTHSGVAAVVECYAARGGLVTLVSMSVEESAGWFPHPDWVPAVGRLREWARAGRAGIPAGQLGKVPVTGDDAFWATVSEAPHRLNGKQAAWLAAAPMAEALADVRSGR